MNLRRLLAAIIALLVSGLLVRIGVRAATSGLDQYLPAYWLYLPIALGIALAACTVAAYVTRRPAAWFVAGILAGGYILLHLIHYFSGSQSGFGVTSAVTLMVVAVLCIRMLVRPR